MNASDLRQLDSKSLADYLWRRLRHEPPVNPPISDRFGREPPEHFVIQAVQVSADAAFRANVADAVRENLRRLTEWAARRGFSVWQDPVTDQHVASLAFLVSELKATDLVPDLYTFACAWLLGHEIKTRRLSHGQFHILYALALLQEDARLGPLWESLWHDGPASARDLIMLGWSRADGERALAHLGELLNAGNEIDLPTTLWNLQTPSGPGITALGRAAGNLSKGHRERVRQGLAASGTDERTLRQFDLAAGPPDHDPGEFPFPCGTTPKDPVAARRRPEWVPQKEAA